MNGVYGTNDDSHPGVAKTNSMKDFLVGGKIISNPSVSVANPGKINKRAANAKAAPDINSNNGI